MWADTVIRNLNLREELLPSAFSLSDAVIHNASAVSGAGPIHITTPRQQWAFAVTIPFRPDAYGVRADGSPLLVRIGAAVESGRIGVGCVTPDLKTYVSSELERTSEDGNTIVDLIIEPIDRDRCGWLVVRNTAENDTASRLVVRSIRTFVVEAQRSPDLIEASPPALLNLVIGQYHGLNAAVERRESKSQRFRILLTHTSRSWEGTRCTRDYLAQRYSDPRRLHHLPCFEQLPGLPNQQLYSGGISLLELVMENDVVQVIARRCIDSRFKLQHASFVGSRLVLCFEGFLAAIPDTEHGVTEIDLRPGSRWRIDDNWFGGLHTVFAVNDDVCVVSSSGADAVLWVDLNSGKVIRRWRLPAELYGTNYALTPDMSVVDHYIHNDIQLGHLNCAYPDGRGGCFISTLIQGDIGHVDQDGKYSLLDRGHVGCHGARLSQSGQDVYFADSCGGRLMLIKPGGAIELHRVDSRWLHDVEEVDRDLYWFCLGDKNEVALIDVARGRELGRFTFGTRGVNVQFVSIVRDR